MKELWVEYLHQCEASGDVATEDGFVDYVADLTDRATQQAKDARLERGVP